eukprot:449004_1
MFESVLKFMKTNKTKLLRILIWINSNLEDVMMQYMQQYMVQFERLGCDLSVVGRDDQFEPNWRDLLQMIPMDDVDTAEYENIHTKLKEMGLHKSNIRQGTVVRKVLLIIKTSPKSIKLLQNKELNYLRFDYN